MGTKHWTTFATAVLVAGFAAAQAPAEWSTYFDGPPGFLLTKKEKKEWKKVKAAAEAEQFIELFWAKRDPDLTTPLNEFKQDFDLRVAAADEAFGETEERGALTDRGEVLILLGRPVDRIHRQPGADPNDTGRARGGVEDAGFGGSGSGAEGAGVQPGAGVGVEGGAGPVGPMAGGPPGTSDVELQRERGAIEAWMYDPRSLPMKVDQQALVVIFRETRLGQGDYQLVKDNPRNTMAMRVLSAVPDLFLKHPDLTSVPRYGLIRGTQPASADQLPWFEGEQRAWPEGAQVLTIEGLMSGPRHFIWSHIQLPEGAPDQALVVGRLRDAASQETTGSFQLEVRALETPDGSGYEVSVPVGPGTWALDLAVADGGRPVAVTTVELATTEVPLDKTVFSPFYWGADAVQMEDPQIGDAFSIGGWHLMPRITQTYTTAEDLSYMVYILQPDVPAGGEPDFRVTVSLHRDGRRLASSSPQKAQLSQVAPDMWMFGSGIDLAKLGEPGSYRLDVELKQVSDDATTSVELPFVLRSAEGATKDPEGE